MEYKVEVFSKILSLSEYKNAINKIIAMLRNNGIQEVEILFGFAWGNEYNNWNSMPIRTDSILSEIVKAESMGVGELGRDDFYITCTNLQTEILFCHETDVHLRYTHLNQPVEDILNLWLQENIVHYKRESA